MSGVALVLPELLVQAHGACWAQQRKLRVLPNVLWDGAPVDDYVPALTKKPICCRRKQPQLGAALVHCHLLGAQDQKATEAQVLIFLGDCERPQHRTIGESLETYACDDGAAGIVNDEKAIKMHLGNIRRRQPACCEESLDLHKFCDLRTAYLQVQLGTFGSAADSAAARAAISPDRSL